MNTKITNKISTLVLVFIALILFGAASTLAQTPMLPANGKIAFASNRDGNFEIYVMNPNGANQVRLTNNPGLDNFPTWSPNGRKIAFVSQNISGSYAIKLMNADGTGQTVVTPIVFNPNFDGLFSLSWSPDGNKIAFQENADIFTVNVDGSNRINLTNHPAQDYEPSWSPDGTRIAFTSNRSPESFHIYTMNADGSKLFMLEDPFGYVLDRTSPDWSPDGNRISYVATEFGSFIVSVNTNGTFLVSYGSGYSSKWSPDNTKIVLADYTIGSYEIYTRNTAAGSQRTLILSGGNSNRNIYPDWQPLPTPTIADFDGDGRSDISVFRPSDKTWYLNQSTNGFSATQFGLSTDKLTPADFDGDGKTDIAVFRDGTWYWLNSSNGSFQAVQFGQAGDVPVPFDYTGDGRAEIAVYRGGTWFTYNLANNQFNAAQFGNATDKPVAADYDGDGLGDYAVYRDGIWYLLRSTQGFAAVQFGISTDKPVPADYDGDGKTDQAVYRDGTWYVLGSQTGFTAFQFGNASDIPAPADYDGDGKTDAAVYRNGIWYLRQSTSGFSAVPFGSATDTPIPTAYLP